MRELKATPGPWQACVLVDDDGVKMTPEQIGKYVTEAVKAGSSPWFSFVLGAKPDGEYDICHVGNGEDSPHNAHLIAAAPELYEALEQTNRELAMAIEKINELLAASITATDMDPPDYWDGQTCHENGLLLAKARGETDAD